MLKNAGRIFSYDTPCGIGQDSCFNVVNSEANFFHCYCHEAVARRCGGIEYSGQQHRIDGLQFTCAHTAKTCVQSGNGHDSWLQDRPSLSDTRRRFVGVHVFMFYMLIAECD